MKSADFSSTSANLAAALRKNPESTAAAAMLGSALLQEGKLDPALVQFARALAGAPHHVGYHVNMGIIFALAGRQAEALTAFERVWSFRPWDMKVLQRLVDAFFQAGSFANAAACGWRVVALGSMAPKFMHYLGVALARSGKADLAQGVLERARDLNPDSASTARALAMALQKNGRNLESEKVLREALGKAPRDVELHQQLAQLLAAMDRDGEAMQLLLAALGFESSDSGLAQMLADAHLRCGDVPAALAAIELALGQAPESLSLLERSIWLNFALDRRRPAERQLRELARLHPDPYHREQALAVAAFCAGDLEAADAGFAAAADILTPRLVDNYRLSLGDMCRFSRSFYQALCSETPAVPVGFALAAGDGLATHRRFSFLVSVDADYLDRYRSVILANTKHMHRAVAHLHVIDPTDPEELALLGRSMGCIVTYELSVAPTWPRPQRMAYYTVIRLIRAQQFLDRFGYSGICIVDVDTQWSEDVERVFDIFAGHDVGLTDFRANPLWFRHNASLIFIRDSAMGRHYLDLVVRYVCHFLDRGQARWRLDQCALFCARVLLERHAGQQLTYANANEALERYVRAFKKADDATVVGAARAQMTVTEAGLYAQLGALRKAARRFEEAEAFYREAFRLDPTLIDAIVGLTDMLGVLGKLDAAIAVVDGVAKDPAEHKSVCKAREEIQLRSAHQAAETVYRNGLSAHPKAVTQSESATNESTAALTAHVAGRLASIRCIRYPFHYFVTDALLPRLDYDRLVGVLASFDDWSWGGNSHYPDRADAALSVISERAELADLTAVFQSPEMVDALVDALGGQSARAVFEQHGFRLRGSARITRDRRHYALGPHRDHVVRFCTLLIYLARPGQSEALGTSLYQPKQAVPYLDNGLHRPFEEFDRITTIPFRPNAAFGFLNMGEAYHGVEPIDGDDQRDLIQLTVYAEPLGGGHVEPEA